MPVRKCQNALIETMDAWLATGPPPRAFRRTGRIAPGVRERPQPCKRTGFADEIPASRTVRLMPNDLGASSEARSAFKIRETKPRNPGAWPSRTPAEAGPSPKPDTEHGLPERTRPWRPSPRRASLPDPHDCLPREGTCRARNGIRQAAPRQANVLEDLPACQTARLPAGRDG